MAVPCDIEVRPDRTITAKDKAVRYDNRVREIDRIVRESWSELAAICIQVRDKELWRLLPGKFHSFDDWLLDAAPVCRATVYRGMGVLSVLAKDLKPEDIAGMEIGNASILAYDVSTSKVRRDPEVIEAAKSGRGTKKLRELVKAKYPEQKIEDVHEEKIRFPESAWMVIEEAFQAYRQFEDETISLASWIEWMANDYLDTQNGTLTVRQAYREAIKARRSAKD